MNSVEFLKHELALIANRFPTVHIKYGYNQLIETHIVELLPLLEYNTNVALDQAWIPVSVKFMETFKDEEVAFVSSDSTLSLEDAMFEFNPLGSCSELEIITEIFSPLTEALANYSFPINIPDGTITGNYVRHYINTPIEQFADGDYSSNSYLAAA